MAILKTLKLASIKKRSIFLKRISILDRCVKTRRTEKMIYRCYRGINAAVNWEKSKPKTSSKD
jgi:hypothetical protein